MALRGGDRLVIGIAGAFAFAACLREDPADAGLAFIVGVGAATYWACKKPKPKKLPPGWTSIEPPPKDD